MQPAVWNSYLLAHKGYRYKIRDARLALYSALLGLGLRAHGLCPRLSQEEAAALPTPGGPGGPGADFRAVLAAVADPLVEMCTRSSEALNPNAASRYGCAALRILCGGLPCPPPCCFTVAACPCSGWMEPLMHVRPHL